LTTRWRADIHLKTVIRAGRHVHFGRHASNDKASSKLEILLDE
jgi:hypothetical protein